MKIQLQNHPSSADYPVKAFSWAMYKKLSFTRRATSLTFCTLGIIFLFTLGGPILIALGVLIAIDGTANKKREHRKYYKIGKLSPLTNQQLEALQVCAYYTHDCQWWSETLERWPSEERVLGHMAKFKALPVVKTENSVGQLEDAWGIISRQDFLDTFEQLVNGLHTARFVDEFYRTDDQDKFVQRLCGLAQEPKAEFERLFDGIGGPRKLIWAWDLTRAAHITRCAYESGFVSDQEGWEYLLQVSHYAHTLYSSLDELFMGIRFGHAYWSNSFESCKERKQMLDQFLAKKTKHRILHAPWTQQKSELNQSILSGFKEVEEQAIKQKLNTLNPTVQAPQPSRADAFIALAGLLSKEDEAVQQELLFFFREPSNYFASNKEELSFNRGIDSLAELTENPTLVLVDLLSKHGYLEYLDWKETLEISYLSGELTTINGGALNSLKIERDHVEKASYEAQAISELIADQTHIQNNELIQAISNAGYCLVHLNEGSDGIPLAVTTLDHCEQLMQLAAMASINLELIKAVNVKVPSRKKRTYTH